MKLLDNIIRKALRESIDELKVYHGSPNLFNRFDHRHHLSQGAGSQAFGWGSYFTTDPEIAKGYLKDSEGVEYSVEIPDDNGNNYFDWYNDESENIERIAHVIANPRIGGNEKANRFIATLKNAKYKLNGKNIYRVICMMFPSKVKSKYASQILYMAGFVGIKYPTGTIWGKPYGAEEDGMNYVIFNQNDAKIINYKMNSLIPSGVDGLYKLRGKNGFCLIDSNENQLSDYFDKIEKFRNGKEAKVELNGKYNLINTEGNLILNKWFDDVKLPNDESVPVLENGIWHLINFKDGNNIPFDKFSYISDFHDGFAIVKIGRYKFNFIDKKGNLISDTYFDYVYPFEENEYGYATANIKLGDYWNILVSNGKYLSPNIWFEDCPRKQQNGDFIVNLIDGRIEILDDTGDLLLRKLPEDYRNPMSIESTSEGFVLNYYSKELIISKYGDIL